MIKRNIVVELEENRRTNDISWVREDAVSFF